MIQGLVYLVTGAASGLGKATAELLVSSGARVVFCDTQNYENQEFINKYGDKIITLKADVTSEKDIQEVIKTIKEKFGQLNGVINCAGIGVLGKVYDFENGAPFPLDKFTEVVGVNTIGTFNVIRLAVKLMSESESYNQDGERGVIINTASVYAYDDGPSGTLAYAASKAALVGMTMPLARDLAEYGIRVVTVAPGWVETPLISNPHVHCLKPRVIQKSVFPKRIGLPEDFAKFVKLIIETPLMNATTIRLDAGFRNGSINI